jgi:hypothetical protein
LVNKGEIILTNDANYYADIMSGGGNWGDSEMASGGEVVVKSQKSLKNKRKRDAVKLKKKKVDNNATTPSVEPKVVVEKSAAPKGKAEGSGSGSNPDQGNSKVKPKKSEKQPSKKVEQAEGAIPSSGTLPLTNCQHSVGVYRDKDAATHSFSVLKVRFRGLTVACIPGDDWKQIDPKVAGFKFDNRFVRLSDLKFVPIKGNRHVLFVSREVSLLGKCGTLPVLDGNFKGGLVSVRNERELLYSSGHGQLVDGGERVRYQCTTHPSWCGSPVVSCTTSHNGAVVAIHSHGHDSGNCGLFLPYFLARYLSQETGKGNDHLVEKSAKVVAH